MRTRVAVSLIRAAILLGGNLGGPKVDPAQGRAARSRAADDYAREVGPIALAAWTATESYGQAAAVLTGRGIRTPCGGKWTRAAVRTLIQRHMDGQSPALTPQQQAEARQRRENGATLTELSKSYNVSESTTARLRV
ncbi:MAG: hypothetical protein ABSC06_05655 [Rhodopila sp.]|jgi:hypothetical protein